MSRNTRKNINLSAEQQEFIFKAQEGRNILVDACIGSGKTTAIQFLCDELPQSLNILYLTYNRLLKVDAKSKIRNKNVTVTNYHGFAYSVLNKLDIHAGLSDLIQRFNKEKPNLEHYDVLILDEYQDIDQELADMLMYIKSSNPSMQIIAVGDMQQKIYDKTTLDILPFIKTFLGAHIKLEFTKCFRLSSNLAAMLGRVWHKPIIGVNQECIVEEMDVNEVVAFLSKQESRDILCLGARKSVLADVLNTLETRFSEQFNKRTVYASIKDDDEHIEPKKDSAIFTTFDSSKGLERPICVVFDYTEKYWKSRADRPQQKYEILRNIFCVAASRGKEKIIFVNNGEAMLTETILSTVTKTREAFKLRNNISELFDFKYKESVEECYNLLDITNITKSRDVKTIEVKTRDELIDLSPCVGIYQEAVFFKNYDIDKEVEFAAKLYKSNQLDCYNKAKKQWNLDQKILYLTSMETKQERYCTQVESPFVTFMQKMKIMHRLQKKFSRNEQVQVGCRIPFYDQDGEVQFYACGLADVVKNNVVYELKFVSEIRHEHFLQCACYMIGLNLPKGILWNTKDNQCFEIQIKDRKKFLDAVARTVTKGFLDKYYILTPQQIRNISKPIKQEISKGIEGVSIKNQKYPINNKPIIATAATQKSEIKSTSKENQAINNSSLNNIAQTNFAVIDVETNLADEVMSIGVIVSNFQTFKESAGKYYIIEPEAKKIALYSSALTFRGIQGKKCDRVTAIRDLILFLNENKVSSIYAYNANFDYSRLPELKGYCWYDIMKLAAYKQYNSKILSTAECWKTGRLKKHYGVEDIMRILSNCNNYIETHNAILDARDELLIMKLLGHGEEQYKIVAKLQK